MWPTAEKINNNCLINQIMIVKPGKLSLLFVAAIVALGITLTIPLMTSYTAHGLQNQIRVPVNVCGNSVNVIANLNPASGNNCVNDRR